MPHASSSASRLTPASPEPLISVVIPTYNRKDDLARCLKALASQTLPASAFEVIVCDDGSTDGTGEMFEAGERGKSKGETGEDLSLAPLRQRSGHAFDFRLIYLRQENRGPAAARNAGIRAAQGKVILFIGDDIAADAHLLERHAGAHRDGPEALAVLGHTAWPTDIPVSDLMRYITDVSCMQFGYHRIQDRQDVQFGYFYTSNVSINRVFLGDDLFDEGFPYAAYEDIELEYRLRKRGLKMVYIPEAVGYHYHPTDLGRFSERQYKAALSAVYFQRKHPDPRLDDEILLVTKLLKSTSSTEAELDRLKAAAAEFEKLDLSKFGAIVSEGRPLEARLREILHSFYGTILGMVYLKGIHDGAKEGTRQQATGNRPSPPSPLSRATGEGETSDSERGRGPASRLTPHASPVVSIIIPVFNNLPYTQKCLESVFAQTGDLPYEVIVVDNASTDGTRAYLEGMGGRIRAIFNTENAGFGRANDQATAVARGRYLLYLNNDTEARAGWLTEMVRLMESDDRIGIVGSKLLFPDGTIQHAGVAFYDAGQPNHLYRGDALADHPVVNRVREMQAVTGACLMLRRGIVEEPAVFDEAFINGFEDVDLCLRVREKGYRVVYCPTSVLMHHESKTPGRNAFTLWNSRVFVERWGARVQADLEQIMAQDGFVQDAHVSTKWDWVPGRMQDPQPRPSIGPKRRDPVRPKVSLVVPVRDRLADLDRCLKGLVIHTQDLPYEIIVVDNGSTDGTVSYLERLNDEQIRAIFNGEDLGFGKAADRVARVARGDYLLLLNVAAATPGSAWLKALVGLLDQAPEADAAQEGRACVLIRRTAFDRIGGAGAGRDAEEALRDVCQRARKAGMQVIEKAESGASGNRQQATGKSEKQKRLNASCLTPPPHQRFTGSFHPTASRLVSIVIPAFNGVEDTRRCLPALMQNTQDVDYEVIVVDNASSDGTAAFLAGEAEGWGHRLRVIHHAQNLGFAKGCNAGARASRGEFVIFLNNDTVPQLKWLSEMVGVMRSDERVGLVGSKLLYPDTKQVQHAGIALINGTPDHPFRGVAADDPRVCRTRDLDMVTGACLMVRRDLFERLGGFDEQYVNGVEDVDLCLRARDEGYRVVYCATSVVEHYEGRSAGRFDRVQENLRKFVARWNGRFDASGRFVPKTTEGDPSIRPFGATRDKRIAVSPSSGQRPRIEGKGNGENVEGGAVRGVWEGSFFVRHSLALVNREVCGSLVRSGRCELGLIPYEADEFGPEDDPERLKPLAERMGAALSGPAEFHVRHQWPPKFEPPPSGHWIMIQPWEFGRVPKAWIKPMTEQVDEIWAYTSFVKRCYEESGVPAEKVFVVPLGVNGDLFRPDVEPMDLPTGKSFRFLFVGGTIYRKGIDVLLDAYAKAFRRSDDVCLVIKDMGQATFYKGQNAGERIRALQQDPDAPEILYLTESLSDREVAGLYAACDCLVHPYRGEGFGLPVAEAMACGLPAIVTQGGSCDDFCSEETAYFIPAQRVNVAFKEETAGQAWLLEPDREVLVERMRWVAAHAEEAKTKGAKASAFIRGNVTWERTASAAVARLTALREKPVLRERKGRAARKADRKVEVTAVLVQSDPERTKAARAALERHAGRSCEVILCDGSQTGVTAFLSERWATFSGRAVAVLSDGVVMTPGAMDRLLAALDADPSVAMAVPSSNVGAGAQGVRPKYQSLKKELEKFARKVAHDRRGTVEEVAWPDAPCAMIRKEALAFPKGIRSDAGLMALARALRKAGRRVVCVRDAYVHVMSFVTEVRRQEAEAVRCLEVAGAAEASGDLAKAVDATRMATEAAPEWAVTHNDLGRCLYRGGDVAGARAAFERAVAVAPDFTEAHSNLGVLLWESGEQDRAVEAFNRAAAIEPDNVDVLYNVGMIYAQVGDPKRAAVFLEQCLALRPDDADIRAQLEAVRATPGEMVATA